MNDDIHGDFFFFFFFELFDLTEVFGFQPCLKCEMGATLFLLMSRWKISKYEVPYLALSLIFPRTAFLIGHN